MTTLEWWKTGIVYQIYPRSYQDSNGDGIGDLPGITNRLDYLKWLGIQAIWISPIYPSPMHDFGYDVADYCDINELFGSLADFDTLLAEAHARDLKIILDLVPNHTSDDHEWFIESRKSKGNPKADWYIWADAKEDGSEPNNWTSFFGGPAWTWDNTRQQYYLHQFVTQQPELNYRNPEVLPAMQEQMRFWLDRGVDGFRVDVINMMMKDPELRDEPVDPNWDGVDPHNRLMHIYTQNHPDVYEVIRGLRSVMDEYDGRVMIGETYASFEQLAKYYGDNDQCHLPFNFHLLDTPWEANALRALIANYEASLPDGNWPNWVQGNHDRKRMASRVSPEQARVAEMLLITLRGAPTHYYGDELGMENVSVPLEMIQDPPALNLPEIADIIGRDPVRTPMQWDSSAYAGFSSESPWLPVADNYEQANVAVQKEDPTSFLNFSRALFHLRSNTAALHSGSYRAHENTPDGVLAYARQTDSEVVHVVLNLTGEEKTWSAPEGTGWMLSTTMETINLSGNQLTLRPNEGVILG